MPEPQSMSQVKPLTILGTFWTIFGVLVLAATWFVETSTYVSLTQGRITNLVASALLLGLGLYCLIRGRKNQQE